MSQPSRRVYRSRYESWLLSGVATALLIFGIVMLLSPTRALSLRGRLIPFALILAYVGFVFRAAFAGVFALPDRVRIRGLLRTTEIPWNEIRSFELIWGMTARIGVAQLRDGRSVPMRAIVAPNVRHPVGTQRLIDGLNEELFAHVNRE